MCLFKRVSIRTSGVPICCTANFLISLMALGDLFLNPTPLSLLCKLTVYSLVTTSLMADLPFFSPFGFAMSSPIVNKKHYFNQYQITFPKKFKLGRRCKPAKFKPAGTLSQDVFGLKKKKFTLVRRMPCMQKKQNNNGGYPPQTNEKTRGRFGNLDGSDLTSDSSGRKS